MIAYPLIEGISLKVFLKHVNYMGVLKFKESLVYESDDIFITIIFQQVYWCIIISTSVVSTII